MAFKRYIRKHGKKLGPYYYENVRSPDGKVKTVYVGTNPEHHPKHKVRKPLVFIILALVLMLILGGSLFYLQNKAYLSKKVSLQQPDFSIDQILLKVLVRSGEFIEKQVRIMNTGNDVAGIDVTANGLLDIVRIDSPSFSLKPGQTKIVALNFSSYLPEQKIEQQPGIYIGKLTVKSEKALKDVPIVVEIETKNVLFDMNLNPVAIERRVKQGTDTTIEVRLFNLESIESQNVDVEYFVKDMNGNTIVTESETVVVKTQASFFKTISVPKNLKPGPYVFAAIARFGNSIGTASYLFDVVGPEEVSFTQFCKNNVLCLGLSLATILLLFALAAYFYFFVGAYLYEKITGAVTLQRKKKEKAIAEPRESFVDKIKDRIAQLSREIEKRRAEKRQETEKRKAEGEKLERKKELEKVEETKAEVGGLAKARPGTDLKKIYGIFSSLEKAVKSKDLEKVDGLYLNANETYVKLPNEDKQKVYERLMQFYEQRNKLTEETEQQEKLKEEQAKKQKGLAAKKEEEKHKSAEQKTSEEEKTRLQAGRKKITGFFHKIGLYRTPEEKQQIALQKEKEMQEKERKKEELKRQKELERQRQEKEKKGKEEELRIQREIEKQRAEGEKKKKEDELKKQRELEAKRREEELKRKKLEEEKRKQEELKRQKQEEKKRAELEKQNQLEQKRKYEEERKRQKEAERQKAEEAKRQELIAKPKEEEKEKEAHGFGLGFLKRLVKGKEGEAKKEEQAIAEEIKLEEIVPETKEKVPEKKKGKKTEAKAKLQEKQKELKKKEVPSEAEELEKEIKSLELISTGKVAGKSREFERCSKAIDESRKYLDARNLEKAKRHYLDARNLYIKLNYNEKKELYNGLMELYNKLAR